MFCDKEYERQIKLTLGTSLASQLSLNHTVQVKFKDILKCIISQYRLTVTVLQTGAGTSSQDLLQIYYLLLKGY